MKKIVAICLLGSTACAMADMQPKLYTDVSLGFLNGEAKESVIDTQTGHQDSLLTWKMKNSRILNSKLDLEFNRWLTFGARGWTTLKSNHSVMNDYDWQDENSPDFTDWSHHQNTTLNFANEFDLNLKLWILNQENYKLGLMGGYQENRASWKVSGGTYEHALVDKDDNFISGTGRSDQGSYPNQPVATYKQKFKTPYVGLLGMYKYENFEVNTGVKWSKWVKASDSDTHIGNFTTYGNTKNSDYLGANLNLGYYVAPQTKIFIDTAYNKYKKTVGTNRYDFVDPDERPEGNPPYSGIQSHQWTGTIGVSHTFK